MYVQHIYLSCTTNKRANENIGKKYPQFKVTVYPLAKAKHFVDQGTKFTLVARDGS